MAEKIDIKDFMSVSGVSDADNVLLARSGGEAGKMTVAVFRTNVSSSIRPSIKDGLWWIGSVNTNVVAEGKNPIFRKGEQGIEWKYENSDMWLLLVPYADISLTFEDLTPAQKEELKLKFSDLSPADIVILQQPAMDMINTLQTTNTNVQKAEEARVIEFSNLKTESDSATNNAIDTATHPTYVGEDYYVYKWNKTTKLYEKTNIFVKGEGFSIVKVFLSVTEMNAALSQYSEGDFVLINTGSVEDPDTGKLYVRGVSSWEFLTDMSGVQGFTGKTPQMYAGTVTTGSAGSLVKVTVTKRVQDDAGGNPQYDINFTIPKGDKGDPFVYSDFTQSQLEGLRGDTGFTPVLGVGNIVAGATPSASLTPDGVDSNGNPKYKLNLTLPKGDQGYTPLFQMGDVTTGNPGTTADASLTKTGNSEDGSPIYSLSLVIPRGDKGENGLGSGNVIVETLGLVSGKKYLFVPELDNTPEGQFVEYIERPIPTKVSELENDGVFATVPFVEGEVLKLTTAVNTKANSSDVYTKTQVNTELAKKVDKTSIGSNNGIAQLDATGKVPSSQLPSYVDDVLEYASLSVMPRPGETGKIYVVTNTNETDANVTYRWGGSDYVEISKSIALGETSSTAYPGDKGKEVYDGLTEVGTALSLLVSGINDNYSTTTQNDLKYVNKSAYTAADVLAKIKTVDGAGSGLDADTLDGFHASKFAIVNFLGTTDLNDINGFGIGCNPQDANATVANNYPLKQAGTLFYGNAAYESSNQIYGSFYSNQWFARGGGNGPTTKTAWKEFAFKTDNVASATKLATPRTINGVPFDGSANITVADNTKFPSTGGTINSTSYNPLNINSNQKTSYYRVSAEGVDKTDYGYRSNVGVYISNNFTGKELILKDDGTIVYDNKPLGSSNYLDFLYGSNSVTTLTSLPASKRTINATLATSTPMSLSSGLEEGQELLIRCVPSAAFTQPIPNSGVWTSMSGTSIVVSAGQLFEISIWCYKTGYYSISIKEQD